MRNPENRLVPVKTPHLLWLEVKTNIADAGQRFASVFGMWDDHDIPTELMRVHFDDLAELSILVVKIARYYYTMDLIYLWRTTLSILRGGNVPFKLNEHKLVTRARMVRGVMENAASAVWKYAKGVRSWLWHK